MDIKIFTMTHKKFVLPPDPMYQPLQVGKALHEDFGYLGDDTGENISALNCYYSELTGFYWIWKNYHETEYVGTCHYRRYLLNRQEKIFTKREYLELLQQYDVITTMRVRLNNSYHFGFSANHNIHALDLTGQVIGELYPDYKEDFLRLVNGPETYFGNILVTSKKLFDEYAEWLFTIFFEVQKRMEMETGEDDYHKRVFGFISEFLLLVWVTKNKLRVYECKVGMLGEKAETREMKETLAGYFERRDLDGAKNYFLAQQKARPDVLMEASDITGELRLCMQIIATAEQERAVYGKSILEKENQYQGLISLFIQLNHVINQCLYRFYETFEKSEKSELSQKYENCEKCEKYQECEQYENCEGCGCENLKIYERSGNGDRFEDFRESKTEGKLKKSEIVELKFLQRAEISREAVRVAVMILPIGAEQKEQLFQYLAVHAEL